MRECAHEHISLSFIAIHIKLNEIKNTVFLKKAKSSYKLLNIKVKLAFPILLTYIHKLARY